MIIVTAVYILPSRYLVSPERTSLCKLETIHPEAAFIVAGDLNKAKLRTRLPKFYQNI